MFKNFRLTKFRNANLNIISSLCATMTSFSYNGCKIPIPYAHHSSAVRHGTEVTLNFQGFISGQENGCQRVRLWCIIRIILALGITQEISTPSCLYNVRERVSFFIFEQQQVFFFCMKNVFISRVFPRIRILIKNSGPVNNFLQSNFGRNFRWSTTELAFTSLIRK